MHGSCFLQAMPHPTLSPTPCSSKHQQSSALRQPALVLALAAICAIGFADMYSYSMPVTFLGQVLSKDEASSVKVMLALVRRYCYLYMS
jgi:predicted MFS family arabinose efflux permease